MQGFLNYLWSIPAYLWYTVGEWVVKGLFPKSYERWFAAEIKALEDIEAYLDSRDLTFHEQLEQKNKIIQDLSKENEDLRSWMIYNPTDIEMNTSASWEGQLKDFAAAPKTVTEDELAKLVMVTQKLFLKYLELQPKAKAKKAKKSVKKTKRSKR